MKKARSNIYNIVIDASEIDYRDCEGFQIVCMECREYVYKKIRRNKDNITHYFSHYRADPEANSLCEERVKAKCANNIAGGYETLEERDQTLANYVASFASMLESQPYVRDIEEIKKTAVSLGAAKGVKTIRKLVRDSFLLMPDLPTCFHDIAYGEPGDDIGIFGRWEAENQWIPQTKFARSIQVRIATDMLRTLLTKPAIESWNYLFAHAWMRTLITALKTDPEGPFGEFHKILFPILSNATKGLDVSADLDRIARMRCSLPYLRYGGAWYNKLSLELTDTIFQLLLEIDYGRWAAYFSNGKEPTEISAELRAKAQQDYITQLDALQKAGVDLSPRSDEEIVAEQAQDIANTGGVQTQLGTVLHRIMTGEGRQFRLAKTPPGLADKIESNMLIVRPVKPGFQAEAVKRVMTFAWPKSLCIDVSDTGVPNAATSLVTDFGSLVAIMTNIVENAFVEEAAVLFTTGDRICSVTKTKTQVIVEDIGQFAT